MSQIIDQTLIVGHFVPRMGQDLDIAALQAIVAVARTSSISAAARLIGQPKQSVSRRIFALEAQLGMRLVERTTRALRLTSEGRALCQRAEHILAELSELQHFMAGHAREPEGPLRISAPVLLGETLLGPAIARYCRRYPNVELEVDLNDRKVDLVDEGYDAAIRVGAELDASLIARLIASSESILVAAPTYISERGMPGVPNDLDGHVAVLTPPRAGPTGWLLRRGLEQATPVTRLRVQVSSLKLAIDVVAAGTGVAMVPSFMAVERVRRGELVRVLSDWNGGSRDINLVHPSRRLVAPRLRAFIDMLVGSFPDRSLVPL